jgi:hypothetical protein
MENLPAKRETKVAVLNNEAVELFQQACDLAGTLNEEMQQAVIIFRQAEAVNMLAQALNHPEIEKAIMAHCGQSYGFRTDMDAPDKSSYKWPVIRACAIDAVLQGLTLHGNQFNIIKEKMYITKEGATQKLKQLIAGGKLSSYVFEPTETSKSSISNYGKGKCKISWLIPGEEKGKTKELSYDVKSYGNQDPDYIMGKIERRAKLWLYETIEGRALPGGEVGAINVTATPVRDESGFAGTGEEF